MHLPFRWQYLTPIIFAPIFLFTRCNPTATPNGQTVFVANTAAGNFSEYWYAGEAEVNTYDLQQSRYGEMRKGEAIMVFVTEDFSKNKQVKLDQPDKAGNDKVAVMKLNHLRRFVTGIYDYSMMQSVFTPVDSKKHPQTLKTTTSAQDWCGHSFMQFNLEGDKYKYRQFSYFETEGDRSDKISANLFEDELWNRIRIAPESLQEGTYELIPSSFYTRLAHDPPSPRQARITFSKENGAQTLLLEYLHLDRTVSITFDSKFPHKILTWTETQDGTLLSKGTLQSSVKSAYWKQHDNKHEHLRDSLGL